MGSRSITKKAYIAGFLDGDGSLMLQIKHRADSVKAYRFMATMCFYQDTRHEKYILEIRDFFNIGYISRRNDGMTELRINGFTQVKAILKQLQPYIQFKEIQADALIKACSILENRQQKLSNKQLLDLVDLILIIQNENYKSGSKKTKEQLMNIIGLTP